MSLHRVGRQPQRTSHNPNGPTKHAVYLHAIMQLVPDSFHMQLCSEAGSSKGAPITHHSKEQVLCWAGLHHPCSRSTQRAPTRVSCQGHARTHCAQRSTTPCSPETHAAHPEAAVSVALLPSHSWLQAALCPAALHSWVMRPLPLAGASLPLRCCWAPHALGRHWAGDAL